MNNSIKAVLSEKNLPLKIEKISLFSSEKGQLSGLK